MPWSPPQISLRKSSTHFRQNPYNSFAGQKPDFREFPIEFALFFIFHLKGFNPEVGQILGGQYELFVVALKLSEHGL